MEGPRFAVTLLVGLFVFCLVTPIGADDDSHDHDERFKSNDGDYECFYDVGTHQDLRFLGAMYCKHGCCGRTESQRCCTEEEKEAKQHKLSGTMIILASTFGGIIAIIVTAVVIYCCCKSKMEKKKSKYNNSGVSSRSNTGNLFTVLNMGPVRSGPSAPPDSFRHQHQNEKNRPQDGGDGAEGAAAYPMSPPPPYTE